MDRKNPKSPVGKDSALAQSVAEALAKHIRNTDDTHLPPQAALCRSYKVSRATLQRAIALLKARGLLLSVRGCKGARIIGRQPQVLAAPQERSQELAEVLGKRILDGELRLGEALPKARALAGEWSASVVTVTSCLRILARDGLVHKKGKGYVVGARPSSLASRMAYPPVVLIFTPKPDFWYSLCNSNRTQAFGRTFIDLADRYGFSLRLITPQRVAGNVLSSAESEFESLVKLRPLQAVTGRQHIERLISDLDGRYSGTLAVGDPALIPDFFKWLSWLTEFGKPVTWFDRNDDGTVPAKERRWLRCHHSEPGAIRTLLRHLRERGHRRILFPADPYTPWQMHRAALLKRQAGSDMEVQVRCIHHEHWFPPFDEELIADFAALYHTVPALRHILERFETLVPELESRLSDTREVPKDWPWRGFFLWSWWRWKHPEDARMNPLDQILWDALRLRQTLKDPTVTVVLSPHDALTPRYCRVLEVAGLRVPEDRSMVSFDNSFRFSHFPVSSLEFGFGYLGHQAFGAITGALPLRGRHARDIPARAHVADRGSVANLNAPR